MSHKNPSCSDCDGITRRDFLKGVGSVAAVAAAGALPVFATARPSAAAAGQDSLVAQLYGSMNDEQKTAVCFGWDHPRRMMISNNWNIVPQQVGKFYTPEQQELIDQIFRSAHNPEWIDKRLQQMKDDAGPEGLKTYSMAIFGKPGTKQFEWVLTGRHLTLRVDGNSEPGVAFGGPIFYGHAAQGFNEKPDHPGNVYWYQALRANEVFTAMDGKQREKALVTGGVPAESPATLLTRSASERPGLPVADMTRDQRELVEKVLADVMAPMSKADVDEARQYLKKNGGVNSLNMAFYRAEDIGNDQVWDVWRLEGPTMVWYFRGAPHVHSWVYVAENPLTTAFPGPTR
jgi:hypothetical protein